MSDMNAPYLDEFDVNAGLAASPIMHGTKMLSMDERTFETFTNNIVLEADFTPVMLFD